MILEWSVPGGQKNVVEEKEKKLAAKQVAVERERMLARRWVELVWVEPPCVVELP